MATEPETKTLTINNEVYAHYQIECDILYLKMRKNIIAMNEAASEDFVIHTISLIEQKEFSHAAYLNIK